MLEIILVWQLCKKTGQIALDKGRPAVGFQILTAVLWILGEFLGAVVGIIVQGHGGVSGQVYIFAIMGAAIGAGIAFAVVLSVPAVQKSANAGVGDAAGLAVNRYGSRAPV